LSSVAAETFLKRQYHFDHIIMVIIVWLSPATVNVSGLLSLNEDHLWHDEEEE